MPFTEDRRTIMMRLSFTESNRSDNLLHIEVPGAIVNIRVNLTDRLGRKVTSVSVSPDDNDRSPDGEGRYWRLQPDGVRIIQDLVPGIRTLPENICPEVRMCVFCGEDIEQGEDGLWADVHPVSPEPDEIERLSCPDAELRPGGYPGLHEPASSPRPGVNLDNQLYG